MAVTYYHYTRTHLLEHVHHPLTTNSTTILNCHNNGAWCAAATHLVLIALLLSNSDGGAPWPTINYY